MDKLSVLDFLIVPILARWIALEVTSYWDKKHPNKYDQAVIDIAAILKRLESQDPPEG